ncbi:unnamed protein product [Caenorhabditis angaria]|uniref:Protein smg-9 n=1 Tax=Caenorhabditis angaria TaxID=860376 RepID=A0A9P1MXR6_9PELO|nr:unnamed protein product [Caenorhabditis angaria]
MEPKRTRGHGPSTPTRIIKARPILVSQVVEKELKIAPTSNTNSTATPQKDLASPALAPTHQGGLKMKEASKFITEYGEISELVQEVLTNNVNFNVVSAIGPQGSGKSTVLSMLAGNNSRHMYRDYVFRPVSREANELSRHQTLKLDIFVANNHIFIDCQPSHSVSILEFVSRASKFDDTLCGTETLKLLAFIFSVSHTVLICNENIIDLNFIKTMRTAELIRPYLKNFEPKLNLERKVNVLFLHTKAQNIDFATCVLKEREGLLRAMFEDSTHFRLPEIGKRLIFVLADIKLRRDQLCENAEAENEDDIEKSFQDFDEEINKIRIEILKNRDSFTENIGVMDEKRWAEMCQEVMKDQTLAASLRAFQKLSNDANLINQY